MPAPVLLCPDGDAPPVVIEGADAPTPLVVVCEHGGRALPGALGTLGLSPAQIRAHFAWDIGALGVAQNLARLLEAVLVHQPYSRLVIDCNRQLHAPSLIAETGEGTPIPGNQSLNEAGRAARINEVWHPFHDALRQQVDDMLHRHGQVALLSVHSFTPVFFGRRRATEIGVLFDCDARFAPPLLAAMGGLAGRRVAANRPYHMNSAEDGVLPVHGEARGLPSAEIEIRNDLIATPEAQAQMAAELAPAIRRALASALAPAPRRRHPRPPVRAVRDWPLVAQQTALLLVDVQQGFVADSAPFGIAAMIRAEGDPTLDHLRALLDQARRAGCVIIHVTTQSPSSDGKGRGLDHRRAGLHFAPASREAEPLIPPLPGEITLTKASWGVFQATALDHILRAEACQQVIVAGLGTSFSVDMAVRDGADRGYYMRCARDACADRSASAHQESLRAFAGYCTQHSTRDLVSQLAGVPR